MALSQPVPQPQADSREQKLVLRLDPLHNWSDLVVLGFAIVFTTYMAIGELLAHGWSKDPPLYNHLSVFAPLAVGLSLMAWRRFRRVRLTVDEDQIEAVSVWGVRKRCRLDDLSEVVQEGKPLARELHFNQHGKPAFKVWRNVWTGMQLSTLSVFLGLPVPGQNEPLRSRIGSWTASLFARGFDALFLVMGGAVLVGAVTADLDARAYQRAAAICLQAPASTNGDCYGIVPVTVAAIGKRSFGEYSLTLSSYAQTYDTTAVSNDTTYRKFHGGMTTYAKLWKGKLTLIQADAASWIESTDNPLYQEGWARTGIPTWIVALVGLIPILSRLHPVVS
ncbi:MAG TPA: hypothetical protein VII89_05600 [Candidatus Dormibacteraeota bacterium]